jgi:hypothetical protein
MMLNTRSSSALLLAATALAIVALSSSFTHGEHAPALLGSSRSCFSGSGCGTCHKAGSEKLKTTDSHREFCCGGTAARPTLVLGTTLEGPPCLRLGSSPLNVRPGTCDAFGAACTCCSQTARDLKKCLSPWATKTFANECSGPTWQFTCCGGLMRNSFVDAE